MGDVSRPGIDSTDTELQAGAPKHTHTQGDDEPALVPGERVGRYVLLSSIGKGGMSVVYLAYDPELDRKVALKLMRVTMLGEKGKLRLQREAQALAKLSHPNVVPVYDVGTVGDQAFVAMEFVEGKTLRKWLRERQANEHDDWREGLRLLIDAGRGLAAAHAAGLVHRDFKPENVLLGEDGRVRVLDFGLARLASVLDGSALGSTPTLDDPPSQPAPPLHEGGVPLVPSSSPGMAELTRADQIIGTPAYMSPEQMRRDATDERADEYSFAVTLYEALYKQRPFQPSPSELTSMASTKGLGDPTRRVIAPAPKRTPVPKWIQRAIARAMHEDPGERYASMDEMLRALSDDPHVKLRRGIAVGAAALVIAAGVTFAVRAQSRERSMCKGGASTIDEVWGPRAKSDLAAAFRATKVPYADFAANAVSRELGKYADSWAKMDDESCAATHLRGDQSAEVLDLRASCLSDRSRELGALVEQMRHADADTVQQASQATKSLTPIEDCADIASLRAPAPRPRDPEASARVDAVQKEIDVVEAKYAVGKSIDAAAACEPAAEHARATGFLPLIAQAEFWCGRAYADSNDERSVPAYLRAFSAALEGRSGRVLRTSAARLAQEYIYASKLDDYRTWDRIASAALSRTGPDAHLEAFLEHARCVAMWQTGANFKRLECLSKYTQKVEKTRPLDDWELTTIGLASSDAGEVEQGMVYAKRGYDYALAENGPAHPRTLEMRGYFCKGVLDYGDLDHALLECRAALAAAEEVAPDNLYVIGKIHLYLGEALLESGKYDDAKAELLAAKDHVTPADEVLTELATVAIRAGNPREALPTLAASLASAEKDLPLDHPNVIAAMDALGDAQLAVGANADARATLDRALGLAAAKAELPAMTRADLELDAARAIWRTSKANDDAERGRAIALAITARDRYREHAPKTKRYEDARAKIEAWIAKPS